MKKNKVNELQEYLAVSGLRVSTVAIVEVYDTVQTNKGLKQFREVVESWRPYTLCASPLSKVNMPKVLDHILAWAVEIEGGIKEE